MAQTTQSLQNTTLTLAHKGVDSLVPLIANENPSEADLVLRTVSTDQAYYRVAQVSGFGMSRSWTEGSAITADARVLRGNQDVTPYGIGNRFDITKVSKATDVYGLANRRGRDMLVSHMAAKELIKANMFNRAFTAGFTGPDGIRLCNASHLLADGVTTQSNYGDGTASIGFSYPNIETMMVQMDSRLDERGVRAWIPGKKKLLVPPALAPAAFRYTASDKYPQSNYNDKSYVNGQVEVQVMHYLTSTTAWFMVSADKNKNAGFVLTRTPLETDSQYDVPTRQYIFTIFEEIAVFWEDYKWIQGSDGI